MEFLNAHTFLGNPLWSWCLCAFHILFALLLRFVIKTLIDKTIRFFFSEKGKVHDALFLKPVMSIIVLIGFRVGFLQLDFNENANTIIQRIFTATTTVMITWLVSTIVKFVIDLVFAKYSSKQSSNELQIMRVISNILSGIVWVLGIITAIDNVGYDVWTLIAGLGIGGLTMALAAQNTAANVFGGVTIFIDKPFKIGDRIRVLGYDGFVETIGLRNVCIRTLEGPLLYIPNAKLTESLVENITREPSRKVTLILSLTYDTTYERMNEAIEALGKIIEENQDKVEKHHFKYFTDFADSSLDITFIYYIRKKVHDIFETQSYMNLQVLKKFNELGLNFAFPTRTLHIEKQQ